MPISQRGVGRDHNPGTQTVLMAGAGIKGGQVIGASDDFGYKADGAADLVPRPARDDAAPAGARSHEADVPVQRPRHAAHGRLRHADSADRVDAMFAVILLFVSSAATSFAAAPAEHDLAFWRAVVVARYAPPAGEDVTALTLELAEMFASADPERRDDIGYSTLANWIYQRKIITGAALGSLTDRLVANLTKGVGERDTDGIFRRSFSALTLAAVAARDNAEPVLDAAAWHRIEQAALAYIAAEQDLRGYTADKGWMRSAAHTADLLKFLGRSRHLDTAGQVRFLTAIGTKLTTVPVVFTHGEDERIARALLSIVNRTDFDQAAFAAWLARTKPAVPAKPTVAQLSASQNWKNALAKLEVLLSNEASPSDAAMAARTALRAALKELF